MTEPSRDIPLPIKREVRQRCGFGCIICGFPLYEYEHMLGWANVQRHVAKEITLLCDRHHREKTSGLLPLEKVIEANKNPHNLQSGISKPYTLHYSGKECEASVGGNWFSIVDRGYGTILVPVSVDSIPLIAFVMAEGHLLLSLTIFDKFNNVVLKIIDNELVYSTSPWDIQLVGRNLIIRDAQSKFLVDIIFDVPNKILINRGRLLCNGVELLIRPDHVYMSNNGFKIEGCRTKNKMGGLFVGPHPSGVENMCVFMIDNVSRYLGDRLESEKWVDENFGK